MLMTVPREPLGQMQRRSLLKKGAAAGAIFWAAPAIDSFVSVAAATSGTAPAVNIVKTVNGGADPPDSTLCTVGGVGNSIRGSAVFVRTEGPATICVTITVNQGVDVEGRDVYIFQSLAGTCGDTTPTSLGTWPASELGPLEFCAPIETVGGSPATTFVVSMTYTGGGGVDGWSSPPVTLP